MAILGYRCTNHEKCKNDNCRHKDAHLALSKTARPGLDRSCNQEPGYCRFSGDMKVNCVKITQNN